MWSIRGGYAVHMDYTSADHTDERGSAMQWAIQGRAG
jgi:hypothetical protein